MIKGYSCIHFRTKTTTVCRMRSTATLLCLALILQCCCTVSGLPWDTGRRCRCLRETRSFVLPSLYKNIEIFPKGGNCRKMEILIFLKNDNIVCVDPEAPWVQVIHVYFKNRYKKKIKNEN
ncbi:C-X-C motif chemokine 13-like [Bombina bombina]|uniref:C-X-C motif chemokine 13-like n=1 Tax=Bombina bombina TaxID=8345 RepID=UPI00235AC921|nr:C-X-C motif chemokine 13-like [Bombina bombina]